MSSRLDSRSLRAFLAVAETLRLRQAATPLHVWKPTLRRTFSEFEARLAVKLFARDTRGVALTSAGERLLPKARRILRLLQEAEDDLASESDSNEIRVGLTTAVEQGRLLESLARIGDRLRVNL